MKRRKPTLAQMRRELKRSIRNGTPLVFKTRAEYDAEDAERAARRQKATLTNALRRFFEVSNWLERTELK